MDVRCQEIVKGYVSRHFPEHTLLGEEDIPPGSVASTQALRQALDAAEWCVQ